MLLGVLGTNEILILLALAIVLIIIPVRFIYKYAKNKGRLQEMERRLNETHRNNVN
jgi:hypothetical protein